MAAARAIVIHPCPLGTRIFAPWFGFLISHLEILRLGGQIKLDRAAGPALGQRKAISIYTWNMNRPTQRFVYVLCALGLAGLLGFVLLDAAPTAAQEPATSQEPAPAEAEAEGSPDEPAPEDSGPGPVVHLTVDSIIHPVSAQHVIEALDHADEIGAEAVVIELNTPGGLLTSTRDIFKAMLSARTPVVVWVAPSGSQAASAGFFILMAADVAAMAPGTNTGAAHPVGGQGEDIEGDMGEKIEQDSAATIRSLANQQGRNAELAEAAVLESKSFTADEALAENLIEFIAPTIEDLLDQIDGQVVEKAGEERVALRTSEAPIERVEMGLFQRILAAIAHPNVAYILMALGWLGLYMELSNPGTILPGVVGAICLILAFYALSVLPVNYAGVALILLALLLFIAEVQVVSYGLLTVGGVISLILGSFMLFKDAGPALRVGLELIVGVSATMLLVVGFLLSKAIQVRHTRVKTGSEGLVGERGVARGAIDPKGKVFVHGEIWRARSDEPVADESEVEVVAVEGLILRVRPLE